MRPRHVPEDAEAVSRERDLARGLMDDEMSAYVPGVNCLDCGRFVGRDGYIGIDHFEMSSEVASVEGQCRRCIDREYDREAAAEHRHLTELVT